MIVLKRSITFYIDAKRSFKKDMAFRDIKNINRTEFDRQSIENEIIMQEDYVDELSKYWVARKSAFPILFRLTITV